MSFQTLSSGDRELLEAVQVLPQELRYQLVRSIRLLADSSGNQATHPMALKLSGGKVYSSQERMRLELTGLERDFARRRELLAGSIGTSDVVKLLHLTPQAIRKRVSQQKLLAVLDGGDYRFPLEQFDAQGPHGVVDGLSEVLQAMSSISDYARLNWLTTPNPIFANATPFEALRKGEKDSAIATAHSIHLL